MPDDGMFKFRLQNALVAATWDHTCILTEVRKRVEIAPDLWYVMFTINDHLACRALVYDLGGEYDIFFPLPYVRTLLLDPMTEGVRQAIKDYHSIGHGG